MTVPVYTHGLPEGHVFNVFTLAADVFVIICTKEGKAGKSAVVEHCLRCAWATCHRLEHSGKWKELAPDDEGELD